MTIEYEEYHLFWSGPYPGKIDDSGKGYDFSSIPAHMRASPCVYAIYGQHPVFGANSLLYIGKTENLLARMAQHFKKDTRFWYQLDVSIRVGEICDSQNEPVLDFKKCIKNIEEILIASNIPPMNRQSVDCPAKDGQGVLIYNFKDRGALLPISSGNWFVYSDSGSDGVEFEEE